MDGPPAMLAAIATATAGATCAATGLAVWWLRRRQILDHPNARSSHHRPTPRGGGLGVFAVVVPAWCLVVGADPVIAAAAALAALSWWDDLRGLTPLPRFAAQIAAVALGISALPADALVFQGLVPFWLDRAAAGFAWLWFVNLTNFMDGIDGITGAETLAITLGLIAVAVAGAALPDHVVGGAAVLAGAAAGFLVWNWHPARVFLGDVGSVPLGYLLGFLLLSTAAAGAWAAAVILPAYYLADATLTLLRRLVRGARVWQAHREHFYQRAVQHGRSHAAVVLAVTTLNLVLIALALGAVVAPWAAIAAAAVAVVGLLALLTRPPGRRADRQRRPEPGIPLTPFLDFGGRHSAEAPENERNGGWTDRWDIGQQ